MMAFARRSSILLSLLLAGGALACGPPPSPSGAGAGDPQDPVDALPVAQLVERGRRFTAVGDLTRASQYYEAALQRGAEPREVEPALVEVLVRQGRLGHARQRAERHVRRYPDAWRMRVVLATILEAQGEPERAIDQLRRALRTAPDAPLPHFLLGTLLARGDRTDRLEEARAALQRYLALAPDGRHAGEVREWLRKHAERRPEMTARAVAVDVDASGGRSTTPPAHASPQDAPDDPSDTSAVESQR